MTEHEITGSRRRGNGSVALAAAGGAGAAIAAAIVGLCCVGPVVTPAIIALIGASGAAWAGGLQPYAPYILGGSLVLVATSQFVVVRRTRMCRKGLCTPVPRWVRGLVWFGTALWLVALAVNLGRFVLR